jgi:O-antigen/teichoic acid export membrane protein
MSAERTVARNTIWLTLQPLAMNVLSLGATMYLTRRLGAAEWGRFNLCLAFVAMLAPLANLGLRTLANRHAAQHRESAREFLGQVLVLRVLFALLTALILIAAAPLMIPGGGARAAVAVMAFGLVVTSVSQTLLDGFQAFEVVRPAPTPSARS